MTTLSPDGIVEEFQARWSGSDLPGKMPEPMVVANGPVVELTLIAVYGQYQGMGYARRALQMLTALCDENAISVELVARQMDAASLSLYAPGCPTTFTTEELVAWYKRHGFLDITIAGDDTRTMVREPARAP